MPSASTSSTAQIQSLNESTFDPSVIEYLDLNDKIDKMQKDVRVVKKEQSNLGKSIMHYMQQEGFRKCTAENSSLQLSESVQQRPLTMVLLKEVFKSKFPTRPDVQTQLLDAIVASRHGGNDRVRLKRVKKRKTRAEKLAETAAAATAPTSTSSRR